MTGSKPSVARSRAWPLTVILALVPRPSRGCPAGGYGELVGVGLRAGSYQSGVELEVQNVDLTQLDEQGALTRQLEHGRVEGSRTGVEPAEEPRHLVGPIGSGVGPPWHVLLAVAPRNGIRTQ